MRSNKCLVQAAQPICQSAVCVLFLHPRTLLDVFAARGTLLVLLVVYQDSQGLFCIATPQSFSQSVPSLYCHQGLFLPSCRILYLFLLSFTRFLFALSSSLSWSLWMAGLVLSVSWHLQTWEECTPWLVVGKVEWDMPQDRPLYYFTCYQTPCRVWPDQIFTHLVAHKSKL